MTNTVELSDRERQELAREYDAAQRRYLTMIEPCIRELCRLHALMPMQYIQYSNGIHPRPHEEYWLEHALRYEAFLKAEIDRCHEQCFAWYNWLVRGR